jgi:hypothetical protein
MIKRLLSRLPRDRNELTYWLGLVLLFIGLTWSDSLFKALVVVGGIMALESVLTSYLAAVFGSRSK